VLGERALLYVIIRFIPKRFLEWICIGDMISINGEGKGSSLGQVG
jgi:hypothetical protein